ncbi:helix-turn-helix transcriptional regulator [Paenibacillus eucommiae]|uniref:AraC-like DNA-binding protein n=1 Tax=Paenibacillus eucommiae TaxID=1355755 RepID=A0ABS4JA06_9BACL|nr:AraC family transcriptional regulator [Paenibacillus eucommiae]MBP1995564.1 AraC-like DNA-binding protein [Paenibacillus eucommiae]
MHTADFHQNFDHFFDVLQQPRKNANRTEHITLQAQIGEGTIRRFVPRCDMEVVISEYSFHRNVIMNLKPEEPMIELSYCFQGARELSLSGKRHEHLPGSCTLQFMNKPEARFEFSGNQSFHMLGIGIPVATFHHFMEDACGSKSIDFDHILGGQSFRMFQETIDPSASVILQQFMQSAQTNGTKNIELECRVLELLSLAFRSFLYERSSKSTKLSTSDMQKIRLAHDVILDRMAEPPTLLELSRLIGLNDYKLKIGFKEMYGTTVYGYLRNKRLEKAFLLLQKGNISVNDTSCAVGYSNPSYFAEAFREKFGINPGEFVKRAYVSMQL